MILDEKLMACNAESLATFAQFQAKMRGTDPIHEAINLGFLVLMQWVNVLQFDLAMRHQNEIDILREMVGERGIEALVDMR